MMLKTFCFWECLWKVLRCRYPLFNSTIRKRKKNCQQQRPWSLIYLKKKTQTNKQTKKNRCNRLYFFQPVAAPVAALTDTSLIEMALWCAPCISLPLSAEPQVTFLCFNGAQWDGFVETCIWMMLNWDTTLAASVTTGDVPSWSWSVIMGIIMLMKDVIWFTRCWTLVFVTGQKLL